MQKSKSNSPLINPVWLEWIFNKAAANLAKRGVQDFETLKSSLYQELGELAQAVWESKYNIEARSRITHTALNMAALCVQVFVTMHEHHGTENVMNALKRCPYCLRKYASKASLQAHVAACPRREERSV